MATQQVQNNPVYQLPHLYIQGLNISYASTTVLAIAPGCCRDSTNNIDIVYGFTGLQGNTVPAPVFQKYMPPLLINSAVNGFNGLDIGTLAPTTPYAVYMIADSRGMNPVGGIIAETSRPWPIMPSGYDSLRLIGFVISASTPTFVYSVSKPQNVIGALTYFNSPAINVLSGGTATSFTRVELTNNSAMPSNDLFNTIVTLYVIFTPQFAGDIVQLRWAGAITSTNVITIVGLQSGITQTQYIQVIAGSNAPSNTPAIQYKLTSSGDSLSLYVAEWTGVSNTAYPVLV